MNTKIIESLDSLCPHVLRRVSQAGEHEVIANREATYEAAADGNASVVVHVANGANGERLLAEMAAAVERQIAGSFPAAKTTIEAAKGSATRRTVTIQHLGDPDATAQA